MTEYKEFLSELQKLGSKPHKIAHCYGVRDAWKWVRKNKWELLNRQKCSSSLYADIINEVNRILAEMLLDGHEITFPYQLGTLRLISYSGALRMDNNRLVSNYAVDWKKTLQYWYEDRQALSDRKVIKRVQKQIYRIQYIKNKARYRNQRYYMFRVNRSLVRALGKRVQTGKMNSLNY